jgi:uncharacterized repeat protein (TIGR03803 family)
MNHVASKFANLIWIVLVLGAFVTPRLARSQNYTDLHDFNPGAGDPHNFYESKLAQGRDGNFYAESNGGGISGNGTVFKITPSGTLAIIHSFNGADGSNAIGGMTLGTDGNLYGNTWSGGSSGNGIVFKITPKGTETALHNFANSGDGANPGNVLVLSTGLFYGTTNNSSAETIYKVTSAGALTTLHTFSNSDGVGGGQLALGSDGNIYGGMNQGGANGFGTAFKMTTKKVFTVLHNFNNTDGYQAAPGMVEVTPGTFYGTTELGGTTGDGVVYSLTPSGTFSVLHSLSSSTDGHQALTLTLATDGNAYGVAVSGGSANCGTIFKVTAAGAFSVVYNFDSTHGCNPLGGYLTQGTDGKLYGLANAGGANGNGVFFSLDLGLSAFVTLMTTSGKELSTVEILGQGFSKSSVVKFGGVAATKIAVTGTTYILATVPAGALTGLVTVTTGATTLSSAQTFKVLPTISGFTPANGPVGTPVTITGTALTQTTKVTFGGVAATTLTVNSDTQVTATVPIGAITGKIAVTTPGGTATSSTVFTVTATVTACADGTSGQMFDTYMHGCAGPGGQISYSSRAALCSTGLHACSAAEWVAHYGGTAPASNYWTVDMPLNFVSGTTGSCSVSARTGTNPCTGGAMLVCPNNMSSCNIYGCGLDDNTKQQFFGGCAHPQFGFAGGTLCCGP